MRRPRLPLPLVDVWRPTLFSILLLAVVIALLTFKLATLTGGASQPEVDFTSSARSASQILENPLNLGHKAIYLVLYKAGYFNLLSLRLVSAMFALLAVVAFYKIITTWYSQRIALLAGVLLACSSWLLNSVRLATPDVVPILLMVLALAAVWIQANRNTTAAFIIALPVMGLLLYTPGLVWLCVPAVIWQRRLISSYFRDFSPLVQALAVVVFLVGLAPLVWAFVQEPKLIQTWLSLPGDLPSPAEYFKNLASVPKNLFVLNEFNPIYSVGRLPLLDIFTSTMMLLGTYVAVVSFKLDRNRFIFAALVMGSLVIALGGQLGMSILMTPVYLLAAGGVALLLQQWFTVFPKNPVARNMAILLVAIVVGLSCAYHLRRYFVAWPNAEATEKAFSHSI